MSASPATADSFNPYLLLPIAWPRIPIRWTTHPASGLFTDGDWVESPHITDAGVRLLQTGNVGVGRFKEQGFRYISDESFRALGCTEVRPGDVLLCRLADPVGRACLAPTLGTRMITSVDVVILRPDAHFDPRFLVHFFSSAPHLGWVQAVCRGGTRDRVSRSQLGSFDVPAPPVPTQRAIADFLDRKTAAIDALIEKKDKLLELLAEKRAALINQAVTKGLDPSVPMKDSGIPSLGCVPAHWRVVRNKVVVHEVVDLSKSGSEELLTVSHITGVTKRSEKDVTMFMAQSNVGYKKVAPGDLVINTMWAWMGALGTSGESGIVSPAYGVYRLKASGMSSDFYDLFYRTPQYITEMTRHSKGVWSSRLRLYPEAFLGLLVALPPLSEQRAIVHAINASVGTFPRTMRGLAQSIERLQEYRQSLITAAVTGQLEIPEKAA